MEEQHMPKLICERWRMKNLKQVKKLKDHNSSGWNTIISLIGVQFLELWGAMETHSTEITRIFFNTGKSIPFNSPDLIWFDPIQEKTRPDKKRQNKNIMREKSKKKTKQCNNKCKLHQLNAHAYQVNIGKESLKNTVSLKQEKKCNVEPGLLQCTSTCEAAARWAIYKTSVYFQKWCSTPGEPSCKRC